MQAMKIESDYIVQKKKLPPKIRERIRKLYAEGYTAKELSQLFPISERTVKHYVQGVKKKIGRRTNELKATLTLLKTIKKRRR